MPTPTIQNFTEALSYPSRELRNSLGGGFLAFRNTDGTPRVHRLSTVAEAAVTAQGRTWLLSMPLSAAARDEAVRRAARMARLRSPHLSAYRLLPQALEYTDSLGRVHTGDCLLELLPEGRPLDELLAEGSCDPQQLVEALGAMQADFRRMHFAHNNLKPENLYWTGDRLVAVRCHHARTECFDDTDGAAFEALKRLIRENGYTPEIAAEDRAANPPSRWAGPLSDGLIRIREATGYGFADSHDCIVIEPRFLYAEDFREGRAEVETETGMGLIDKEGNWVIEPRYEEVFFDENDGISCVREQGHWSLFDYGGRRLTGPGMEEEARARILQKQPERTR